MLQNSEEAKARRQQLLQEREKTSFRRYFTSVGCAIGGAFLSLPFLRNKVMMQCRPEHILAGREPVWTKPLSTYRHIFKNEGNTKFVRGVIPFMTAFIPIAFIRQSATNSFSRDLDQSPSRLAMFSRGFAAATVTSLLSIPFTPFTIAATKMMADTRPAKRAIYEYHGPLTTLRSVYSMGGPTKLFVGAVPIWLHNIAHFTFLWALGTIVSASDLSKFDFVQVSASLCAFLLAHPIDTVRTRMQFRLHTQVTDFVPEYRGMTHCAKEIWANEGIRGFYRGATGTSCVWFTMLLAAMYAANRGHTHRGKEAKQEALVQRRMVQTKKFKSTADLSQSRPVEDRFYGFESYPTSRSD